MPFYTIVIFFLTNIQILDMKLNKLLTNIFFAYT